MRIRSIYFGLMVLAAACVGARAQTTDAAPLDPRLGIETLRLWDGAAPNAHGTAAIDVPTLTVMRPQRATGSAVIVAPGGAYRGLSMILEGREPADRLTELGVTVFILKYRLSPDYQYPIPLEDARRAVRLVRSMAAKYGYSPDRIGMMGFSAGGHLAAMAGTAPTAGDANSADPVERMSSELNFMVLGYPWLNAMQPQVMGPRGPMINYCSVTSQLTQDDCKRWEAEYTPALRVSASTPPAFIYHTTTDLTVPVKTAVEFYSAMQAAGRDAELHIFARGGHGSGTGGTDPALSLWPKLLEEWLRNHGWLTPLPQPKP